MELIAYTETQKSCLIFNETLKDPGHFSIQILIGENCPDQLFCGGICLVTCCVLSHRESILKTAKALVEDTKLLVAGAASSQEKLAQAAHSSAKTITQLTEVVKLGATSMGSEGPETQVIKKKIRPVSSATGCHSCFLSLLSY